MKILAVDTSSRAASCAWLEDDVLIGEFFANASLTHSQTILPMIESMTQSINRSIDEVDLFAVSHGPGSFTGLRIGIGAVKGMAMALEKPCVGISTLHGLALNLSGFAGIIVPVMDARANQVYTAVFGSDGVDMIRLHEDMAVPIPQLYKMLLTYAAKRVILVGDGAELCQASFMEMGIAAETAPINLMHQRAGSLCIAAAAIPQEAWVGAAGLEPFYLRLPQAERERLERLQNIGG